MNSVFEHVVEEVWVWLYKLVQILESHDITPFFLVEQIEIYFKAEQLLILELLVQVCFLFSDVSVTLFELFLFLFIRLVEQHRGLLDAFLQLLDLLRGLGRDERGGMGILFVTHNFGVVAEMADRVLVMYLGRVVESAPADAVFAAPNHPYTQALISAVPVIDPASTE